MLTHLYELLQQRARAFPDAIAIGGQQGLGWKTLTSRQLLDCVDHLATELVAQGVREGDRVVLWLPNSWRTPVYLFALWRLGAIAVPFDREMNPEAASRIIATVAPRCILVGSGERPPWTRGQPVLDWWEPGARQARAGQAPAWQRPAEALATISYTSGTTGQPKGCMIAHANLCFEVAALPATIPLDSTCRLASILPLSHLFELTCGLLYPLIQGAAIHYIPSRRPPEIVRVLAEQRITHMIVVPQVLMLMGGALDRQLRDTLPAPVYRTLMAIAPRLPLPARRRLFWPVHRRLGGLLQMIASGGAPLPPDVQQFWERLGVRIVQGYGTSETAPVIAGARADGSTPIGSVGPPLPGVEVRLSAEGEVLVRGPNVMQGYWQDPTRTASTLQDGWYATGDLARIDPAGNLFIIGRAKDLIVLPSGMKVWPQDVEDVLRSVPGVKDAAVMAVTTPGGRVVLHAYVLPASPAARATDITTIIATANGRLAQHQRVAQATWWAEDNFPRTPMGKVRRHLLPDPSSLQAVQVAAALAADDPVGQAVAGVARVPRLEAEQTLSQLGLDSLGLVDLALALEEKMGKAVGDGDLRLDMTVAQLRTALLTAPDLDVERADGRHGPASQAAIVPDWPYTWGRHLRWLSFPITLLYRYAVTRTAVQGAEHLAGLPPRVIFAGTHHSFVDMPLFYHALARSPARFLARRLIVATEATGLFRHGLYSKLAILAFGLYPLHVYGEREWSLHHLVRLAAAGNAILIFPQGRHTRPAEERAGDPLARFRQGVAHLAAALNAPVVPFGLAGGEGVMPPYLEDFHGSQIAGIPLSITRGPLAIAFGPLLTLGDHESPADFVVRLQAVCFALTRQAEAALGAAAVPPGTAGAHRQPVAPALVDTPASSVQEAGPEVR